ncbi:MAG: N-acetyltransferase family protein [Chloroflexota bacterium]
MADSTGIHLDDIIIRSITRADADVIGALWARLVAYHHALDAALPHAAPDGEAAYARRIEDQVDDSYSRVFVAEHDGRIIGFVLGMIIDVMPHLFEQDAGGFLADIYVAPAYRRAGVGRALVDALAAWFRSRGVQRMEWYVAARNESGRDFWHRMGGRDVMVRMRVDL